MKTMGADPFRRREPKAHLVSKWWLRYGVKARDERAFRKQSEIVSGGKASTKPCQVRDILRGDSPKIRWITDRLDAAVPTW